MTEGILNIIAFLLSAAFRAIANMGSLLGPFLLLALFMHLAASSLQKSLVALLGRRAYLALLGWLSVSLHEIGHAVMCLVFFHRIKEIRLFDPDPAGKRLGFVTHSYNPKNPFQAAGNLFIALGPVFIGTALIYLAAYFVLPKTAFSHLAGFAIGPDAFRTAAGAFGLAGDGAKALAGFLGAFLTVDNLASWRFWAFLYLVLAGGGAASLSLADIQNGLAGLLMLALLIFLATAFCMAWGLPDSFFAQAGKSLGTACALLFLALCLNALAALVLLGLRIIWR
ncbi:MAG: hypothetical protein QMD09_07530 [Desulfatibacillaceae bacterium]|nr:hypothetical protein [Desulfatibacillaceae bacterium]